MTPCCLESRGGGVVTAAAAVSSFFSFPPSLPLSLSPSLSRGVCSDSSGGLNSTLFSLSTSTTLPSSLSLCLSASACLCLCLSLNNTHTILLLPACVTPFFSTFLHGMLTCLHLESSFVFSFLLLFFFPPEKAKSVLNQIRKPSC